jgi:hypothetical protein
MLVLTASAQLTDQSARELAAHIVRSELHSTVNFKSNDFLGVQRAEELEQSLEVAASGQTGFRYIYKATPAGYEVKENAIAYHVWTDIDPVFVVAINPVDGRVYRIHGFGLAVSLNEFEKLIASLHVQISNPEQAESVTDFYQKVNPGNRSMTPISDLLDLKQAAERQCRTVPFDPNEENFATWWKHAKTAYVNVPFKQTATRNASGYAVEWIVLSSPGAGLCGGAPLRARVEIGSDGHIGEITFTPVQGAVVGHGVGHAQGESESPATGSPVHEAGHVQDSTQQ